MGNSCSQNSIVEKNNDNDKYIPGNNKIRIWPEMQFKNAYIASSILSEKGYNVITTEDMKFPIYPIDYNRIVIYCENGIVKKIPRIG
jgi:hypothetical protein